MYVNVYVPKSGGSVVPKSDVHKCSDPLRPHDPFFVRPLGTRVGDVVGARIAIAELHEFVEDTRCQKGCGGKINSRFALPLSRGNDGNLAALLVNHFIVEHGGENDGHP